MARIRRALSCALAATASISFASVVSTSAHAQDGTAQSQVVSSVPATYTPDINDGTTYAINQVGSQIFTGGSFSNEQNHGSSTVVKQKYLFAFNAGTGAINTAFAPVLDGTVQSIEPGPTSATVYVAGSFNTVNGVKSKSIVQLNTSNGSIAAGWKPAVPNGVGQAIRYANNQLLLGGDFSTVGGTAHSGLVGLNPTTGAMTSYTKVQFTGHHNYNGSGANAGVGVNAMTVSPDGTRLVAIGNFKNADGVQHDQIAMLDLSGTTATLDQNWNTNQYTAACYNNAYDSYVRDVDWAPNGDYFVVGATGGSGSNTDGSRSLCDSASRWSATDTGADVHPTWVDYTGNDTILSVAITNTVVYVGGHQRWLNNPNAYDSAGAGAVPRPGLAALDPASGLPLTWNPGRNPRGAGAYALFASATDLYVGSDTMYFGNYKYLHKRIGYFPLTGGYVPASTATASLPANVYEAGALPNANNTNVLYRVNAGGPGLAAIDDGPDWLADGSQDDPGADYRNNQSSTAGYDPVGHVDSTVPATTPTSIFSSERWSPTDSPPLSWDFPVAAGTPIQVRLYFANRYSGTSQPGDRVFDVSLDGTTVLSKYDIVADVGDQTGTTKTFDITSDGDVDIDLTHETENPLINGIEIVRTGAGGTTGSTSDLAYRSYSGSSIGALTTVPDTGVDWSTTRGAFMVGSTIFYGAVDPKTADQKFYKATFDGKKVGAPVAIDPYDDPTWDGVDTGSHNTYDGVKTGYYSELANVTGAFYSDGRLYYSQYGSSNLYWRYFSPDSAIIGGQEFTVTGASFPNTAGEFLSGSTLYYANRADGSLHTVAFSNGGTNGTTPSVDMTTDRTVSGPAVDGNDWRAHGLFAYGKATQPNQPPTARATASCANLACSFDGSGSSDPDGTIASYAWTFGDGSTATGSKPTHAYAKAGTYPYTLTVTDDQGTASPVYSGSVTVTGSATPPIAFTAVAHSYATSTTSATVTTPSGVGTGDTELLFVSAANATANAVSAPTGWTQVATQSPLPLQTAVFRHTVAAGDAGKTVTVSLTGASPVALQLADYSGVSTGAISATTAADTATTASHTAPSASVTATGSWVVSYWADKSSTTTGWNLPNALANRDVAIGTGGGHTTGAIGDSNGPVATGAYPAQTANVVGGSSGKAAMISLVLPPQS